MNKITVDNKEYEVSLVDEKILVDGELLQADVLRINENEVHIIYQNKNYRIQRVSSSSNQGLLVLNEQEIEVFKRSMKDEILEKIGISSEVDDKMNDLLAPMPGKILKVLKQSGEKISKSEGILVLEAMKMENVLKANADAIIAEVKVSPGDAVEKNQILITFE